MKVLCNYCGDQFLDFSELINQKVVVKENQDRHEIDLLVCCGCFGLLCKFPLDDFGFRVLEENFKVFSVKGKKFPSKRIKKKPEGYVPRITMKGKEKQEVVKPTPFSFTFRMLKQVKG
jgi:hypothetical protein